MHNAAIERRPWLGFAVSTTIILLVALGLFGVLTASAGAASGTWDRAWGKGVNGGGAFGICTVASSCHPGDSSTALGGELNSPNGTATDAAGNVYVTDYMNNRVQKFNSSGSFLRAWGKDVVAAGPDETGTGFEICVAGVDTCQIGGDYSTALGGELNNPIGIATDSAGGVYVADSSNNRIQKYDSSGTFLLAWGKNVASTGPGNTGVGFEVCVAGVDTCQGGTSGGLGGELNIPVGVATDSANNVYVADQSNHRIQRFDSSGVFQLTWGKDVINNGVGSTAFEICVNGGPDPCQAGTHGTLGGELYSPYAVAVDAASDVYVTDFSNKRVQKYDSSGNFLRAWGMDVVATGSPDDTVGGHAEICVVTIDVCQAPFVDGPQGGEFNSPFGVAADSAGGVYVSDAGGGRIQKFNPSGGFVSAWGGDVTTGGTTAYEICTVAANCKTGDGGGLGGEMYGPRGLATDTAGDLFVADQSYNRIQKFADHPPPSGGGGPGPGATLPSGPTGQRAAAKKRCKKKFRKGPKRAKCIKKAKRLPV
ncbi:MAG: hypothetical protein QOD14_2528 [Solirubrobacterales bacterium]|jgi:hypothetical protein|nr:hypothetical protein [Solirubrobacterales bacterium]